MEVVVKQFWQWLHNSLILWKMNVTYRHVKCSTVKNTGLTLFTPGLPAINPTVVRTHPCRLHPETPAELSHSLCSKSVCFVKKLIHIINYKKHMFCMILFVLDRLPLTRAGKWQEQQEWWYSLPQKTSIVTITQNNTWRIVWPCRPKTGAGSEWVTSSGEEMTWRV